MGKVILWGTGTMAQKLLSVIEDTIVLVVDNDKKKWGTIWNGYIVNNPSSIVDLNNNFDKIIIGTVSWRAIREQILKEFSIESYRVENIYYSQRKKMLNYYKQKKEEDKEKYISYLEKNPLDIFNGDFTLKYMHLDPEIYFDQKNFLFYVYYNNKKMYFSSDFFSRERIKRYYASLLMEQDTMSPHKYQTNLFHVCKHDVVLDAGVAEGNFALDIVDLVDKLYLVECNKEWIKALKCTFEPYKDKVEIIEGMLGNGQHGTIRIDDIVKNSNIDFIKMDIEGSEYEALLGAKNTLKQNDIKWDICVYHNIEDEKRIKKILEEFEYETEVSDGYMVFMTDKDWEKGADTPKFVRGLIRGRRKDKIIC